MIQKTKIQEIIDIKVIVETDGTEKVRHKIIDIISEIKQVKFLHIMSFGNCKRDK